MKGGHSRSGPAPDMYALRRHGQVGDWTVLPAEGREGPPPAWPLTGASARELELWERLWTMPQATAWEHLRQDLEVALYVRNLVIVEQPGFPVSLGTLVRQMADSLGLTVPGMRSNRWRVLGEDANPRTVSPSRVSSLERARQSSRDRLANRLGIADDRPA